MTGCLGSDDVDFTIMSPHASGSTMFHWSKEGNVRLIEHPRVIVKGVKSLGGHFACLCQGFEFYEVKKNCYYFSKRKWKYLYTFNHFYSEKSSKRAKEHKSTTMTPNLPE
jgi:hypothetical protein